MFSHESEVEMTRRYRKDHDLMNKEADDLVTIFNNLNEEDIFQYRYPSDFDLNKIGVRGIYLNNYLRWDPIAQHEEMIKKYNFRTRKFERTFDCYDFVDCHNYMEIHDILKFYKHGYSKVTDHVCREIRHGRISRQQGIFLVHHYENGKVRGLDEFANWLGTNTKSLEWVMDTHRNKLYWKEIDYREWSFIGMSKKFNKDINQKVSADTIEPIQNYNKLDEDKINYIVFGKGYP